MGSTRFVGGFSCIVFSICCGLHQHTLEGVRDRRTTHLFSVDGMVEGIMWQMRLDVFLLRRDHIVDAMKGAANTARGVFALLDICEVGVQLLLCLVVIVLDAIVSSIYEPQARRYYYSDCANGSVLEGRLEPRSRTWSRKLAPGFVGR